MQALLCLLLAAHAFGQTADEYAAVLARHGVAADALASYGLKLEDGRCVRLKDSAAVTLDELDALLPPPPVAPAAAPKQEPQRLPSLEVQSLDRMFDGSARSVVAVEEAPAPQAQAWEEPAFEGDFSRIRSDLADAKRRKRALNSLSSRFAKDETSPTGLTADAPEALRALADALHAGDGGPAAAGELRRELALVANLKEEQKTAFARELRSARLVYVALSRSNAAHALDASLYFKRLEALLAERNLSLPDFIAAEDPAGRDAARFFLRAHAYDLLLPRLNAHPQEAGALAAWLFPDGGEAVVRERASQLEGLMTQLAAQGRRSGALAAFVTGLEARAAGASPALARRIAAYLAVNERLLPKTLRPGVDALKPLLPSGLLEDAGLVPSEPYDLWPSDRWTFASHFASTGNFKAFLTSFQARGYALEPGATAREAALSKDFGGLTVRLTARLYPGDEEGFLRGEEAKRYLAAVRRDLRDPAVQGVMLRNHAQFRVVNLFDAKVTPGKLLLDGACRSAWDLQTLRRRCPTCSFIVNTGTGVGKVNGAAVAAVVEGLARGDGWSEIGEQWARSMPRTAARIQGPWTPPYAEALTALEASEKEAPASGAPAAR